MANESRVGVEAHMFMAECTTHVNRGEELGVGPETATNEQDESCNVLAEAQMKETRKCHVRELDALHKSFKKRELELLRKCHE